MKLQGKTAGFSGCRVALELDDMGEPVVVKTCEAAYNARLKDQGDKQSYFRRNNTDLGLQIRGLLVPSVYENKGDGKLVMEYMPGQDYIQFVENAPADMVGVALDRLVGFVRGNMQDLRQGISDHDAIIYIRGMIDNTMRRIPEPSKAGSLAALYAEAQLALGALYLKVPELAYGFPAGVCHGDLSLSNVIFRRDGVPILVDFLDMPFMSPLFDLAKLRQDAVFHWTSTMYPEPHDSTKVRIVDSFLLDLMDVQGLSEWYLRAPFILVEALNWLRIVPYVHESKKLEYVLLCADRAMEAIPCI